MMKSAKGLVSSLCLLSLLFGAYGTAAAEQKKETVQVYYAPIQFVFDDVALAPPEEQKAFIYEGSTYVPLRFMAYSLRKSVAWDGETYTVTLSEPDTDQKTAEMEEYRKRHVSELSDSAWKDTSWLNPAEIDVYFEQVNYVFDGERREPPEGLPGFIYEDSLYVPMRFLSESIGKAVEWNPETYIITAKGSQDKPDAPSKAPSSGTPGTVPGSGSGGKGGSGPVGPAPAAKPSLVEIQLEAGLKLYALKDEAERIFTDLENQYKSASEAEKPGIRARAEAELAGIDSKVEALLAELRKKLEAYGYDTAIIEEIRGMYNAIKDEERANRGL